MEAAQRGQRFHGETIRLSEHALSSSARKSSMMTFWLSRTRSHSRRAKRVFASSSSIDGTCEIKWSLRKTSARNCKNRSRRSGAGEANRFAVESLAALCSFHLAEMCAMSPLAIIRVLQVSRRKLLRKNSFVRSRNPFTGLRVDANYSSIAFPSSIRCRRVS